MDSTTYISITDICAGYKIERTYIIKLKEFGLINFYEGTPEPCLYTHDLPRLEKILRFHQDLKINFEGIEVILNLLNRIEEQGNDLRSLQSKLHLYEDR